MPLFHGWDGFINDNIDEFEFGVDILDLKSGYLESTEFLEDIMIGRVCGQLED